MALRKRRVLDVAVALALASASCGTHVLVGKEDRRESISAPVPVDGGGVEADPDAGEIVCGGSVCTPRDLGGGFGVGPPCCFAVTKCGASFSNVCVELDSAGTLDPICPSAGGYPGCCRPDDTCGISATGTAFGCVNPFAFLPTTVLGTCAYGEQPDATP